ncbi:MAG TPA: amino acid permease [Bdellovibrionota bacterium]|nr:amino acid permease [Bdellovibrionota bacterium]
MSVPPEAVRPELRRVLGLWDSVAVIVGIIIGSGIFFTPTSIAKEVGSWGAVLFVWILGGLAALCGSLTYAELATAWPRTGGIFVYLRECFGPLPSFLFGWASLIVIRPSAVAGISVIFATYVAYFIPVPQIGIKLIAVSGILIVSIINYTGVRATSVILNIFTSIKIFTLVAIAFVGLVLFRSSGAPMGPMLPATFNWSYASAFGVALIGVFWTYDGWVEITNIAGEIREPAKIIPRALLLATVGILTIYTLVNLAYLRVLTLEGVQNSGRVASDTLVRVFGPVGGSLIAVAVIVSTFGALNGTTLTGPRIFFAMAVDGLFFSWARKVSPRYKSPSTAIALEAALAIPLVITWTFDQVATYFVYMFLIFYALSALAVFRLRRMPGAPIPTYRTWGYPWTTLCFVLVAVGILINTTLRAPVQAGLGLLILGAGVPVYYLWRHLKSDRQHIREIA